MKAHRNVQTVQMFCRLNKETRVKMLIFYFILTIKVLAEASKSRVDSETTGYSRTRTPKNDFFETEGVPNPKDIPLLNRKIFKGMRVTIREHPYVVSIRRLSSHYLTGALLSYNTVLTVAHPVYKVPTEELGVVAGENYSDRGKLINPVVFVIIHEQFDPHTLDNDMAMIRTYEDFPVMTNIKTIRLLGTRALQGQQAFVSGWGRCDFTGKELCLPRSNRFYPQEVQDPMLRTVTFTVTKNVYCSQYGAKEVPLKSGMMCLGNSRIDEPMTSCLAVPGAPLVVRGRLEGILSWGLGCGFIFDMPLVYVNLQKYRPWLKHNLEKLSRIPREALTVFYTATKSYIVEKWLYATATRPYLVNRLHAIHDYDMQLLDIDLILMSLMGDTYDIRDFIYDGMFHAQKINLYIHTKQSIKKNMDVKAIYSNYTRQPSMGFLDRDKLNEVGLEMRDGEIVSQAEDGR